MRFFPGFASNYIIQSKEFFVGYELTSFAVKKPAFWPLKDDIFPLFKH